MTTTELQDALSLPEGAEKDRAAMIVLRSSPGTDISAIEGVWLVDIWQAHGSDKFRFAKRSAIDLADAILKAALAASKGEG